jgi:hypothetical protein
VTDYEMAQRLAHALVDLELLPNGDQTVHVRTFAEANLLTEDDGIVVRYGSDGSEYQITVVKVR